jgi:hypothetical protein
MRLAGVIPLFKTRMVLLHNHKLFTKKLSQISKCCIFVIPFTAVKYLLVYPRVLTFSIATEKADPD